MELEGFGTDPIVAYEPAAHAATGTYTTTSAPAHTETNDDTYVYEALATDRPRIRLITVWQGVRRASYPYPPTDSDEILCTIDAFEVDSAPPYIALSYTWGDPIPLHTIRLNGKSFTIRGNLFDFLTASVASDIGRWSIYLWIDQLCIDQSNKDERGHQVKMMANIYRNAQTVVSWLDWSCHQAVRDLATKKLDHDERRAHIITIFSNEYFFRLWIVQEFLLARDIVFMCRYDFLDYDTLSPYASNQPGDRLPVECSNAINLFASRTSLKPRTSLALVLNHYSILRCADNRDQVYGLLGLVDSCHEVPEVDYQKTAEEVYQDTVQILLTRKQYQASRLILDCAEMLAGNMCLPNRHLYAIRNLFEDINMRVKLGQPMILHGVGFDSSKTPDEWWYEYQGIRYGFPVQSDADRSMQSSYSPWLSRALQTQRSSAVMLSATPYT